MKRAADLDFRESLEKTLGTGVTQLRPLAGGDICKAYQATLADGENIFVKTRSGAPQTMFATEAQGLDWLRQANALRLPRVLAATPDFLALEYLHSAPRQPDFEEKLGRGLAALHRYSTRAWGLDHDNFIGPLAQANATCASWPEFYIERRLRPQVEMAIASGRGSRSWRGRFENLYNTLPTMIPEEPPSRLHGDLWPGNLQVGPEGQPCLIDPAAYAGHREIDLAMMRLFGGFGQRVFASYNEAYPLQEGHQKRVHLYQLYPLLVHVNLFGGGYASSVESAIVSLLPD